MEDVRKRASGEVGIIRNADLQEERLFAEMFRQVYEMFKKLKRIKVSKRPMICPQCRNKNTYLMKKESKDWEDISFAWYGCRDCSHKFIKKVKELKKNLRQFQKDIRNRKYVESAQ